mmetsp:Transcript_6361/g.14705  ORF Transcript_6361/g.14705 Transcript_6361/m.14705 type:complete len:201 (+) Transcript_6361:700-1302(+)
MRSWTTSGMRSTSTDGSRRRSWAPSTATSARRRSLCQSSHPTSRAGWTPSRRAARRRPPPRSAQRKRCSRSCTISKRRRKGRKPTRATKRRTTTTTRTIQTKTRWPRARRTPAWCARSGQRRRWRLARQSGCARPSAASWATSTRARRSCSTTSAGPTCRMARPAASRSKLAPLSFPPKRCASGWAHSPRRGRSLSRCPA